MGPTIQQFFDAVGQIPTVRTYTTGATISHNRGRCSFQVNAHPESIIDCANDLQTIVAVLRTAKEFNLHRSFLQLRTWCDDGGLDVLLPQWAADHTGVLTIRLEEWLVMQGINLSEFGN